MDTRGTELIIKTRVTFVFRGYGDLSLTDTALIWNKSTTSIIAFGLPNLLTDNYAVIPLESICKIEKYTYFPGGGLKIIIRDGKEFKFSFKSQKDYKIVWNYLSAIVQ